MYRNSTIGMRFFILSFLSILGSIGFAPQQTKNQSENELSAILKSCAEYCQRLENSSLDFVCKEEILEKTTNEIPPKSALSAYRSLGGFGRNYSRKMFITYSHTNWLYDFQLVRRNGQVTEKRTLIKINSKDVRLENAPLMTQNFRHKRIVFGPTGLLSQEAQNNYDYSLKKATKYHGYNAVIIEATPKKDSLEENLYGKIWINREDYSILKIEFVPESLRNYQAIMIIAEKIKAWPHLTMTAEYEYEKNGIRFPCQYIIREKYTFHDDGREYLRSETFVTYRDYQYFTVETDVIY